MKRLEKNKVIQHILFFFYITLLKCSQFSHLYDDFCLMRRIFCLISDAKRIFNNFKDTIILTRSVVV